MCLRNWGRGGGVGDQKAPYWFVSFEKFSWACSQTGNLVFRGLSFWQGRGGGVGFMVLGFRGVGGLGNWD